MPQETSIKENNQININNYQAYNHLHKNGLRASAGVSILVRKDVPQNQISIDSDLQVIAVKITLHKSINICSIYIPLHDPINESKLNKVIEQIPKPHILLGDFNSHNTVWGCLQTHKKGKDLENIINSNNLCILNNNSPTYLNSFTGSYPAIDLTLSDPSSYMDYTWKVYKDLCDSDYFPIIIDILQPRHDNNRPPRRKTNKANWIGFKALYDRELVQNPNNTCMIDYFTETLIEIANKTIPKTSPTNKRNTPWFNDECRMVIQQRNAALRKFNKEPSTSNLNTFKLLRAKARKIIKQTKKSVGKIMSTNSIPQPKLTQSGRWYERFREKYKLHLWKKVTDIKDIADALVETFSANSSSNNKHKTENPKLSFKSNNAENYNGCFTLGELKEAIQKSHNPTVGPDEIHYEFLKQLPWRSLDYLLAALNEIWESSKFSESWRVATIIPIPKPG